MKTVSQQSAEDLLYYARMFRATINKDANPALYARVTRAIDKAETELGLNERPRPAN